MSEKKLAIKSFCFSMRIWPDWEIPYGQIWPDLVPVLVLGIKSPCPGVPCPLGPGRQLCCFLPGCVSIKSKEMGPF